MFDSCRKFHELQIRLLNTKIDKAVVKLLIEACYVIQLH